MSPIKIILIVLGAILGVILAVSLLIYVFIVTPMLEDRSFQEKVKTAERAVQRLSMAIDEYYLDNGRMPRDLQELVTRPESARNWNGPYVMADWVVDPWGVPYKYRYPGKHRSFDIWTEGADQSQGYQYKRINNWD